MSFQAEAKDGYGVKLCLYIYLAPEGHRLALVFKSMHQLLLNNFARHVSLTEEEQNQVKAYFVPGHLPKRSLLVRQGNVQFQACFLVKGCMIAYHTDDLGRNHLVRFAMEDWWMVDVTSFDDQSAARYTIEALEDCDVLLYTKADKDAMLANVPKLEKYYRILYQSAIATFQRRILDQISLPAEVRFADLVAKYPQLEQRLPQHVIASYLGITPQHLSRIKRQTRQG